MAPLGPITLAVISIAVVWGGNLRSAYDVKVIGHIQAGLPPLTVLARYPAQSPVPLYAFIAQCTAGNARQASRYVCNMLRQALQP